MPDLLDAAPDESSEPRPLLRPSVVAAGLVFLALAAFWGWILVYQLQNRGEEDMPDRLDDLAWTSDADAVCQATQDRIAALPSAPSTPSADERADVIDTATAELEAMLTEIEALTPQGPGRDAEITTAWLADYRIWLADRDAYADALREDPEARFVVTERYGSHITKPIDRFARVNEMEACMTSGDV